MTTDDSLRHARWRHRITAAARNCTQGSARRNTSANEVALSSALASLLVSRITEKNRQRNDRGSNAGSAICLEQCICYTTNFLSGHGRMWPICAESAVKHQPNNLTRKLLNRFSQNSVERWHVGTEETIRFWW